MPEATLVDAINLALARALADDPDVVVFGEDVGVNGGVFRATAGLQQSAWAWRRRVSNLWVRSSSWDSFIPASINW